MSNSFRGYVEIEIGGKKRPTVFDMNTMAMFSDRHNTPLSFLFKMDSDTMTVSHLRTLMWAGLVEGARKAGLPVDFSIEDVGEWITQTGIEVINTALDAYRKAAGESSKGKGASSKK